MAILYLVVAVFALTKLWLFVAGPIVIKLKHTMNSKPDIETVEESGLPLEARSYFLLCRPAMETLGFKFLSYVRISRGTDTVTAFLAYYCNREAVTVGVASAILAMGPKPKAVMYTEFCTKFTDGTELDTNNSAGTVLVTKKDPEKLIFRFHSISSAQVLWNLHLALLKKEKPLYGMLLLEELKQGDSRCSLPRSRAIC